MPESATDSNVTPPAADATATHEGPVFLNRELTWLEFNRRVLAEALDERTPLLERLAFLAIFNSNLDEYYQKRVGGLKQQLSAGVQTRTIDGMTAADQITAIRDLVLPMLAEQHRCFAALQPKLREHGVCLLNWDELTTVERDWCKDYYRQNLFPVLTPLAVDPGHPFPFLSNLSMSLGVILKSGISDGLTTTAISADTRELQFARVKVPDVFPDWIRIEPTSDGQTHRFVSLIEIIRHHLGDLFEGMELEAVEPFRVTRNANVTSDDEDAEDLLEMISQQLRDRRFARAVRLETDDAPSKPMNQFLIGELGLEAEDVYHMPGLLDYTGLWAVQSLDIPELRYRPWKPVCPPRLADDEASIFSIIRAGDVMVHHPFEAFRESVERFITEAAADPDVVAIKMTLYRTSSDSPFIPMLIKAAEAGKQVVVLVELKARFDEARNVQVARKLEQAGVHVVYGVVGLKTHTKTAVVVRREPEGMRVYAHIGTGNYNSKTANLYTDLGLLTCDPRLTLDLVQLFHFLTGRSEKRDFDHLLIAPINMRRRFNEMIDREIGHAKAWREQGANPDDPNRPSITAKMNSLEDKKLIRKLYEASQAGVKIDLIVRGFCCLRPGVPGLSENIRVVSLIGRFLEHSRIFVFHNAGQREYYIGSADWMYRNLNSRVECITPVFSLNHQTRLQQILDMMLADQRQAWDMHPDGTYTQRKPPAGDNDAALASQDRLMNLALREANSAGIVE